MLLLCCTSDPPAASAGSAALPDSWSRSSVGSGVACGNVGLLVGDPLRSLLRKVRTIGVSRPAAERTNGGRNSLELYALAYSMGPISVGISWKLPVNSNQASHSARMGSMHYGNRIDLNQGLTDETLHWFRKSARPGGA